MKQRGAQAVDVGAFIDGFALGDFRRHIVRRAHDHVAALGAIPGRGFGQAEVGQLHAAVFFQHDVLRLDVAVDNAQRVRVRQAFSDARGDMQSFLQRQFAALLEQLIDVVAFHVLHGYVVRLAGLAEVVHGNDGGMVKPARQSRFADEVFHELAVARQLGL